MSLISEQQKKNAGVKQLEVRPIKTSALPKLQPAPVTPEAAPTEEAAFSAVTAPVKPEQDLPVIPETQSFLSEPAAQPQPQIQPEVINLTPIAPVEIGQAPEKAIAPTVPLWQDVSQQLGRNAALKPEVANTTLPSFSVQNPDNSSVLNRAFEINSKAYNDINSANREQYAAAQRIQEQLNKKGALPNTPDATKKWYSAPAGFLGDVLFGSEKARKLSDAGVIDLSNASFGRAGAGLGGELNYAFNLIPSLFVGAVGEATAGLANGLERIGVDKKTAEGFSRNGFLQFLPKSQPLSNSFKETYRTATERLPFIGGSVSKLLEGVSGFKPSQILNFNFEEANKRNLLLDALAGNPLNDVNDPDGSVKYGRIYTRSQRKEGSSATDDPIGFALQLGTYLFSPGEIPGDLVTSSIIGKLWNTLKPASKLAPETAKVIENLPALPSSSMRAEANLANRANEARTATAGRLLNEPSTLVNNKNFGFDLGAITEEQTRRLNNPTPRLNGFIDPKQQLLPSSGQITTAEIPGELLPRLNGGEARLEGGAIEFVNTEAGLGEPRLDGGEAYIEYPSNAKLPPGANPAEIPRVYLGSSDVTRTQLPPVFDPTDVPETLDSFLLPYSTPAKTALELGLGNPNIRLESPGALSIRSLEQVKQALALAEPKLLEGFDGITWEDFKQHLSTKVSDIGQFSSVGAELSKASDIGAVVEKENRRAVITAERIKKIRSINARVEENSGRAISAIDQTQEARAKVREQIKSYESLVNDTLENTLNPLLEQKKKANEEAFQQLRQLYKDGASEAEIERGLTALEKYNAGFDEQTDQLLKSVENIKSSAQNLIDNDLYVAELRYKQALENLKQTRFNNDVLTGKYKILEDVSSLSRPTDDDLFTAAEELAQHKLALEKPMQQLEQLFDETVDYGRRTVDEVPFETLDLAAARKTVEDGGILKLYPSSFLDSSKAGLRMKDAWLSGDYTYLTKQLKKQGFSLEDMLSIVVENSNTSIAQANKVSTFQTPDQELLTKIDKSLWHGTALDNWSPPDNLIVNGSRGELGGGTYYTLDKNTAIDYAKARVGENVSPKTMDFDVNPTVAELTPKFSATLDARKPVDKSTLKPVFADLPQEIRKPFFASLNRKRKPLSYVKMRELLEESIAKAGVNPTEELLQQIDTNIGKNLRALGFDSVVDKESGFVLGLDNSRVSLVSRENIPAPSAIESATARYNADAYASKHYGKQLTTDANLRDSTYKVLAQTKDLTDQKLAQIQDEIIGRGLKEQDTILPKLEDTSVKPSSFVEAVDNELTLDDICGL